MVKVRTVGRAGKYIYAITQVTPGPNDSNGLEWIGDVTAPDGTRIRGINDKAVSLIPFKGLAAIASDISAAEISQIRSAIGGSSKAGLFYILAHRKVVESIRQAGRPVVPIQFGSILLPENVHKLLQGGYSYLSERIQFFSDKDEYGITVVTTPETENLIFRAISADPALKALQPLGAKKSQGSGTEYFRKLKIDDLAKKLRFRLLDQISREFHVSLSSLSVDSAPQRVSTGSCVFSKAYLIPRSRVPEFDATLRSLRDRFTDRLRLRVFVSGPWAPYSFSVDDRFSRSQSSRPRPANGMQEVQERGQALA